MSEKFEVPPEHSRILSSPYTPSQPWSKIIIAFAAGLACAVLVITATFVWPRGNSDSAKVTAESSRVALAKKATTPAPKATDGSAQRDEAQRADTSASTESANAAPSEPTAQDDPCAREAWPYVSQKCAGKQRTRNVRVITTDRTAPSTIVTAVPETSPRASEPAPRTTDGSAPPAASVALAPTQAAPAESASNAATSAASAAPIAPAPSEQIASPIVTPAAASEVPMPKAKPDAIARTEPETTGSAPATETEREAPIAAAPAQESKSSRKSRERHDRRDARSNARRDTARANPDRQENARQSARQDESPFIGDEPRDSRASRSRGAQEQATRSTRSRTIQVDDDDDGVPATRSVRIRDDRRDARGDRRDERRIVIERAAEPERVERSYAREEKPKLPFPFFFLGGGNND
jgi:hypothetical protein